MLFAQIIASLAVLLGIYLYDRKDRSGPLMSTWACILWSFIGVSIMQPVIVVFNLVMAVLHFRNFYTRRYPPYIVTGKQIGRAHV